MDKRTHPETLPEAIEAFCFVGALVDVERLSHGHIHQSFLVTCAGGRYVLQQLNDRVFSDVAVVVSNGERVLSHLQAGGRPGPRLVETEAGARSWRTRDAMTWRAFTYLEGTLELVAPRAPADAFEAARAFADYRVALSDLPAPVLADTIPRFHDLPARVAVLEDTAGADPLHRRAAVNLGLERALLLAQRVETALGTIAGPTPPRLVHNDAKLSNVRFDESGQAVCVIDYDTTMVGAVRHDVGELVRSMGTHAAEDCAEEEAVDFDLEMAEAVAQGYLSHAEGLESSEISSFAVAGPEMTVENAVRFLTDHLSGDTYFAISRPDQNLDRCRTHLRLAELMLESQGAIQECFETAGRAS